ncbi:MAG: MATE family efflux transporter [Alphaproteobacteria bacterium]
MTRARLSTILALALPIIGGMSSQTLFNLVDTAMVGRLGTAALAGVGIGGFANFMLVAVVMGLSAGVQAMCARRKGEGRLNETAVPLNGGLVLAFVVGLPLSIVLISVAQGLFLLLNDDPEVAAAGVPYLKWRLIAMVGVGMNFAFRGYWNGISMSTVYLRTLLVMHVVNIPLNYVLIFGAFGFPELGTTGASIGTVIATYVGVVTYFWLGWRRARVNGFLVRLPRRATMLTILRLSVPASIQQFFFAAGFTAMFWIVGLVGTRELAAANVLINVVLVAILPGLAMGLAAASLVGQALGAGDLVAARRWGWDVVKVAAVIMGALGLPALLAPDLILGVFLSDAETLALARWPLRMTGATIIVDAVGMVLMNAMLGAGAARTVMIASISIQWILFLPLAYLVGPVLGFGLLGIWTCQIGWRVTQAVVFTGLWRRGKWAEIRV